MWICTKILPKSIVMKIHKCKSLNWCDTLVWVWYQKMGLDRDLAEMFLPTLTPTQRKKPQCCNKKQNKLSNEQKPW